MYRNDDTLFTSYLYVRRATIKGLLPSLPLAQFELGRRSSGARQLNSSASSRRRSPAGQQLQQEAAPHRPQTTRANSRTSNCAPIHCSLNSHTAAKSLSDDKEDKAG
ncbi:hypothetical protein PRNP1_012217 [Phytophthora ramorum]